MTGVAAPLLAGFTISLIALVIQGSASFRWPSLCTLVFTLSAVLLISTVQAGFWIRHYRPSSDSPLLNPRSEALIHYLFWNRVARYTYDAGIFLLLSGLAGVLAPKDGTDALRWAASITAALAAGAELVWAAYATQVGRRLRENATHD